MSTLSDKILALSAELGPEQKKLEDLVKQQSELHDQIADCDDAEKEDLLIEESKSLGEQIDKLTPQIEKMQTKLAGYRDIEKRQAQNAKPVQPENNAPGIVKTTMAKEKPYQSFVRFGVIKALGHLTRKSDEQIMEELFPNDLRLKNVFPYLAKTEAPIATTTDANYAAALVQEDVMGLLEEVEAQSVVAALALWAQRSGGMILNFGRNASVRIPRLTPTGSTPTEPAWVREGGAIPVGQLSLGSATMSRYKLAEILVTTMELREMSIVDIEALFRRAMQKAYARVLDNSALDASAAVADVRPAGLLNGITIAAGDATGGLASVQADLEAMVAELLAANEAAVPVLAINNRNRMGLTFMTNQLGDFVFRDDLNAGRILTVPIVSSGNVPYGTAYMFDASSLAFALDAPMFDISQVATVVMANADGTAPTMADNAAGAAIGTAGQVNTGIQVVPEDGSTPVPAVGYTARSMFQTYSEAVRMVAPTSFGLLRAGTVAGRNTLAW